jgi:hypothetical protein
MPYAASTSICSLSQQKQPETNAKNKPHQNDGVRQQSECAASSTSMLSQ